jgi:hypothetical protein
MEIDLLLLSRDLSPPRRDVWNGIATQEGVTLRVHRVTGPPRPGDANRWETIARARNQGKRLGSARWVMLLDDDVVLGTGCMTRLAEGLLRRPGFAALGADCAGEMKQGWVNWDYPGHVGMAATLFRRDRLAGLTFRWETGKCECQCCCDDLRRVGHAIGYLPGAKAWHRPSALSTVRSPSLVPECRHASPAAVPAAPGRVLAAFDRRHARKFHRLFLASLRASGNREPVTAVAYGLYPSERRLLAALPGVDVVALPANRVHPAIRRLRDFQTVIARWPEETAVAYWDAGDVLFQARVAPVWDLVRAHPDVLLAVRDTIGYPENPVIGPWTSTIRDLKARHRAFGLLSTNPYLNGGFAAGTARALLRYLQEAHRLRHSAALRGTSDWGDQTALNLYCHSDPGRWREIPQGWNYCLCHRDPRHFRVRPDGRFESTLGEPIQVVHGNAGTLRLRSLSILAAGLP